MKISQLAQKIETSSTLAISANAKQLKSEGKDVIGFGAGEPDFDTPSFIKKAAIASIERGETKYTPASGLPALKKSVCRKFKNENGLEYAPDEVIINCGAKHSLFNVILCLAEQDDEVIIPAPYWVSYPEMVKASGATPIEVKCGPDFKITPSLLKENITAKTKILILNSPSNPTGALYTKDELKELSSVILENGIYVISDEIYEHLTYEEEFYGIAQVSPEMKNRTIVINGISKAYSMTGWRIGYAAGDREIIAACGRLQSHSTSNPATVSQYAAIEALDSPESSRAIQEMVAEFRKRRDYIYDEISSIDGIKVNRPAGAFYIFPDISSLLRGGISSSDEFATKLLEEKLVAVVPGEGFGAPGYIRLSYAASMDNISKGLSRIKEFIEEIK